MRRTSHSVIGVCLKSQGNHSSTAVPTCLLDNFFLNRRGDTDILTVLNFLHCPSVASLVQCCDKGPANHVVQAVTAFMDFLVLKRICLRTDGELASGFPAQARLLETTRHPWKRRHDSRALHWVLLNAAIEVLKVRSDTCGSLSRSQQTSPEDNILVWLSGWPITRFHIKFAPFFRTQQKFQKFEKFKR